MFATSANLDTRPSAPDSPSEQASVKTSFGSYIIRDVRFVIATACDISPGPSTKNRLILPKPASVFYSPITTCITLYGTTHPRSKNLLLEMIFNKIVATAILFAYASIAFPANIAPPSEVAPGGAGTSIPSAEPQEITPTSFAPVPSPLLDTAFPPVANDINGLCGGGSAFKNPLACKPGLVCAKQVGSSDDTLGTCQIPNVSDVGGSCGGEVFNAATCAVGLVCISDAADATAPGTCQIVVATPTPTSEPVGLGGLVTGTEEVVATGGIVGTEPVGTPSETVAGGGIVGTELVEPTIAATSETTVSAPVPSSTTTTSKTTTTSTASSIVSTVFGENFPPALTSFTTTSEELAPPSPSNGAASVLPTLGTEPAEPPTPSVAPAGTEPVTETPSPAGPSTPTEAPASSTTSEEAPPTPSNPAAGTQPVPEPSSTSATTATSEEIPPTPSIGEAETETLDELTISPLTGNPPTLPTTTTSEGAPPSPSVPAAETEPVSSADKISTTTDTTFIEVPPSLSVPAAETEPVPPTDSSSATSSEETTTVIEVPPSPSVPAAETEPVPPADTSSAATTADKPPQESSSVTDSSAPAEPNSSESTSDTTAAVAEPETTTQAPTSAAEITTAAEATTTAAEIVSSEEPSTTTSDSAIFIPEGPTEESSTSVETTTASDDIPPSPSDGAGDIVSTTTAAAIDVSLETSESQVAPSPSTSEEVPTTTTTTSVESSVTTADAGPRALTLPEAYSLVTRELSSLPSCLIGCLNPDHSSSVTDDTANDLCIDAFGNDPFALVMCIVSDCTGGDFDVVINALTDPTITEGLSNACNVIYASIPETISTSFESSSAAEPTTTTTAASVAAAPVSPIFSSSTWSMFAAAPVKNGVNGTCGGYAADAATCLPGLKCVSKSVNEVGTCQKPVVNDVGQTCGGSITNNPASCAGSLACMPNFIPGLPGTCQMPVEPSPLTSLSSSSIVVRPTTTKKHKKYRMVIKTVECTTTTVTTTTSTQYAIQSSSP
ncbi:hypothetical protein CcCBS67573_g02598 [Chytriomyces confervae]|uniref:Uncharacterized protein n=1 Tax=Chytriomyces confervae TaxID=246404 RepID=A0A507FKB1_9FUNG|nr:hypothetical protein CcCBS67573_g02598 [Chytriomyces confervae]